MRVALEIGLLVAGLTVGCAGTDRSHGADRNDDAPPEFIVETVFVAHSGSPAVISAVLSKVLSGSLAAATIAELTGVDANGPVYIELERGPGLALVEALSAHPDLMSPDSTGIHGPKMLTLPGQRGTLRIDGEQGALRAWQAYTLVGDADGERLRFEFTLSLGRQGVPWLEAHWEGSTGALACVFPLQDGQARLGLVVVTPRRIDTPPR